MKNSNVGQRLAEAALGLATVALWMAPIAQAQDTANKQGVVRENMDPAVKPGDDFFRYCNGAWLKRTEIPPDRPGVSVFSILQDLSLKRTSALIEEAAKSSAPPGSGKRKIADLYHSYIDEAGIEAKGLVPLQPHLRTI